MKRIMLFALALALVSSPLIRSARADNSEAPEAGHRHHGDKKGKDGKDGRKEWFKKKLGLTDEQAKKLEAARKSHWEAAKPLRENLKEAMRKLRGELLIKASEGDVSAALDGVKSAREALRDEGKKFKDSVDSVLSPVQRAKMLVMREKMRRHRMMAMGGRHERCEGKGGRDGGWGRGDRHRGGEWGGKDKGRGDGAKGDDDGGPQSEE